MPKLSQWLQTMMKESDQGERVSPALLEAAFVEAELLEKELDVEDDDLDDDEQTDPADVEHCLGLLADIARRDADAANDDPAKDALCLAVQTAAAITAERRRARAVVGTMGVMEDALHAQRAALAEELLELKKGGK